MWGVANTPHMMSIMLAVLFAASLLVPTNYKGRALTPVLGAFFLLFTLSIGILPAEMQGIEWLHLLTRIIYIVVLVAILLDVLMKGRIYQIYQQQMEKYVDSTISAGIVLIMLSVWGFVHQLAYNNLLDWKLSIALSTITLFVTASIALWLSTVRNLRTLRLTGFTILVIAFIKLIFFDLSALDLLIRAVLFIAIGGIGLLLSGRLLRNDKDS